MKLKDLQIPDEVWDSYEAHAAELQGVGQTVTAVDLLLSHIDRFKNVKPMDRVIVVDTGARQAIEKALGNCSLMDVQDLVRRVERLASLEIGEVKITFTEPQWAQLKRYAGMNKKPLSAIAQEVVNQVGYRFFDMIPSA